MRVSAIIPAINEEAWIAACAGSAWAAGCDEVIVADGGSSDATRAIAEQLDCRLVVSAPGRARQQNEAARIARGDILLFVHADNRLSASSADQIREALDDGSTACGAFHQRIEAPGMRFRILEWGNAARVRWSGAPYGDQGIFMLRGTFEGVGGFPDVPLLEDLLLMRRLRQIAWPCLLPGPLYVSPRRWQRHGIVRQTLRNWAILGAHRLGASPERLARYYARHDAPRDPRTR